jgi:hypothetical protein
MEGRQKYSQHWHWRNVDVQHRATDVLPPEKRQYILYRKLSWPGDRLGRHRKFAATGIRSTNKPSIPCRNTHYVILAASHKLHCLDTYSSPPFFFLRILVQNF